MVTRSLTAVVHKEDDIYVAQCPEVGTISQGTSVREAIANLKVETECYLEVFPVPTIEPPVITTFDIASAP